VQLQPFNDEYVERLRNCDPDTEHHFVNYFRQLLRIKLRARYLPVDVIEDLQQETFIRFFRKLREKNGIHHPERIGAFVNSICNHVLFEYYRSQGKNQQLDGESLDPPDKILNLENLAIKEEVNGRVRQAIDSLSPRERDLVRKVFFQEMEKDKVCTDMGVSRDYLRVLLHRAIEHLRDSLETNE